MNVGLFCLLRFSFSTLTLAPEGLPQKDRRMRLLQIGESGKALWKSWSMNGDLKTDEKDFRK